MAIDFALGAPRTPGVSCYAIMTDLATNDRWDAVNGVWASSPSGTDDRITLSEGSGANAGRYTARIVDADLGTKASVRVDYYLAGAFEASVLTSLVSGDEVPYGYRPSYFWQCSVARVSGVDRYRIGLYRDGAPYASATSVTLTVKRTTDETVILSAVSPTQDGSTNYWEYIEDPSTTDPSIQYLFTISYTADGASRSFATDRIQV